MAEAMTSHGSCLCGELKYSFTGKPVMQALCHCLTCRKISGSTSTTTLLIPSTSITRPSSSSLKQYTTTHESGLELTVTFCSKCGTTVYKETSGEAFKGFVIIFAGTLDEGDGLELGDVKPTAELWCKYRVGWVREMEGVMQCEEFPEG